MEPNRFLLVPVEMESIGIDIAQQATEGMAVLAGRESKVESALHVQQAARPAIMTPWVDFLSVGGLAVVPFAVIYALHVPFSEFRYWNATVLVSQVLLNYPHFIASYRLLYQSKAIIQRYRWASIYVPIVLVSYVLFCLIHPLIFGEPINIKYWHFADWISTTYLAVHYTGQAWGMVASFSYLSGTPLVKLERYAIRGTLYVFMLWHMAIANVVAPEYSIFFPSVAGILNSLLNATSVLAHVGMAAVVAALVSVAWRSQRVPPLAMVVPVPVLYFGYLILMRGREGIVLLQVAHALQYLIFPLRVEINRTTASSPRQRLLHVLVYIVCLVAVGSLVFVGASSIPSRPVFFAAILFGAIVNIHHYYIDGCVWKIGTPEVRKDLFKHLAPVTATRPAVARAQTRLPRKARRN
jgi:hypothetical protein